LGSFLRLCKRAQINVAFLPDDYSGRFAFLATPRADSALFFFTKRLPRRMSLPVHTRELFCMDETFSSTQFSHQFFPGPVSLASNPTWWNALIRRPALSPSFFTLRVHSLVNASIATRIRLSSATARAPLSSTLIPAAAASARNGERFPSPETPFFPAMITIS